MQLNFFKKHSTLTVIIVVIVVIIAGLAGRALNKKKVDDSTATVKPVAQLIKLSDYSQNSHVISANGTVESLQQVDLKSQVGGKVTRLNVKVGSKVSAGQVIATTDQSSVSAALTSARGALAASQANYNKLLAGASNENIEAAKTALESAKSNLANTTKQAQLTVDNAFTTLLNSSPAAVAGSTNTGSITATITGSYNNKEEGNYDITLTATGGGVRFHAAGLETADGLVSTTPQPLGKNGLFIQFSDTNIPLNNSWTVAIPNTSASSYTANLNAYNSALQNQTSSVDAAQNAVAAAQANLDLVTAQARPADVQAAQAAILAAQGQVQAAEAAYQNTLIVAPFSGTVSALPIKYADLLSPGQKVATVVNQGGLQIKVFVSGNDLAFIKSGDPVSIGDQNATGTVTNLASSVDSSTRTAEVDIAVANPKESGLTVGQSVSVVLNGSATSLSGNDYLLPLQAVKITPDGHNYVYILDENSKAKQVEVSIGTVDGEHVEVTKGLTPDMQIVANAYDVTEGDSVQVNDKN